MLCCDGNAADVSLYPNPTHGVFTMEVKSEKLTVKSDGLQVEIYNVLGEKVYSHYQITKLSNYQIDISNQPSGIYLLRVLSADGTLIGQKKIILSK